MAIVQQSPDENSVLHTEEDQVVSQPLQLVPQQETEQLTPSIPFRYKHALWYYLLVACAFLLLLGLTAWLVVACYVSYTAWYDAALTRAYSTGHTVGIAEGVQQGTSVQQVQDAKSFAKTLAQTKANAAKDVLKVKLASYQAGKQDAVTSMRNWWSVNCRYDSVIKSYICDSSP